MLKLTVESSRITSLVGKEPDLVQEVGKYWLDIVGLNSTHSLFAGVVLGERDTETAWAMFCVTIAKAGIWSCGRKVASVSHGGIPQTW